MARPTAEQLAKINKLAVVPLTEDQTHVFTAKIIGTKRIDKYKMKITPNFLRKMADQVKEGVALLLDHSWTKFGALSFPYGRTFDSLIKQEANGELELYGDHYMVKGQEIDGIATDHLALGIDSGTIFDTSAGFITTEHNCSICGDSYYRSNCSHIRGQLYDGKECLVLANDGYIMENSIVFDGGYEGAGITRGTLSALPNNEDEESQTEYEPLSLDAKSLNGDERVFYFFSNKGGVSAFTAKQNAQLRAEGDESVTDEQKAAALAAHQTTNVLSQIKTALGVETDDTILAKINALSVQAKVGEQYKLNLIEEASGAGVRALGEAFNVEAMKLSLSHLQVSEIEKIRDTYNEHAKAVLGGGGRHTTGEDIDLPANALNSAPTNPQDKSELTPEQRQAKAAEDARASLKRTGFSHLMKGDK
ncbi:hypothetical protein [Paenibacillus sp. UMB4589-SE434]|uniref:hypothetical protein n=1 Tax=Paenibacillus sp. UMB4589-SE434 TaxID=3046314 RepID=UPI00254A2A68|nr:hypothetical protein [Paenibacillus sp. UMB4589-SE434]MDK8182105.1 hypothetical protein [Paenibacillus sp. UMB4589-SE434]